VAVLSDQLSVFRKRRDPYHLSSKRVVLGGTSGGRKKSGGKPPHSKVERIPRRDAPQDRNPLSDSWLTITGAPPMFFISVASKELRAYVSGLESTLAGIPISVDSKGS